MATAPRTRAARAISQTEATAERSDRPLGCLAHRFARGDSGSATIRNIDAPGILHRLCIGLKRSRAACRRSRLWARARAGGPPHPPVEGGTDRLRHPRVARAWAPVGVDR